MSRLLYDTPETWVQTVLDDFDSFLLDHAGAEKKAAGMAISMLSHYPDRVALVNAMADLAVEEMTHFREVLKIIHARGLVSAADEKDAYVARFRKHIRAGTEAYFLDRLLVGGIIEARGAERFGRVAGAVEDSQLKRFYQSIARSEERHLQLFEDLARLYFPEAQVQSRLQELLQIEAGIVAALPIRAALH